MRGMGKHGECRPFPYMIGVALPSQSPDCGLNGQFYSLRIGVLAAYKLLIVDDSEDDRFFLERELKSIPSCGIVGIVYDGEAAIDYLSGAATFANRALFPMPDVMLLDLKMPRMNGFDVLRWLQRQSLAQLTVIVLSSSMLVEDIHRAKALGAHHYVVKNLPRETAGAIAQILDKRNQASC